MDRSSRSMKGRDPEHLTLTKARASVEGYYFRHGGDEWTPGGSSGIFCEAVSDDHPAAKVTDLANVNSADPHLALVTPDLREQSRLTMKNEFPSKLSFFPSSER